MNSMIFALTEASQEQLSATGSYYVIETFPYPQFVLNEDGENKCFDSFEEAIAEAEDCQQGYVIVI